MKVEKMAAEILEKMRLSPFVSRPLSFVFHPLALLLFLYILIMPAFLMERASKAEVNSLKTKIGELSVLSGEYRSIKERVDIIEKRASIQKVNGIAQAVDDIFSSLSVKGKVKSIKSVGIRDIKDGITEERADILLEKVSMNELVNVLHRMENGAAMLAIKKINLKKSFEKPELLDVTMTAALFARK